MEIDGPTGSTPGCLSSPCRDNPTEEQGWMGLHLGECSVSFFISGIMTLHLSSFYPPEHALCHYADSFGVLNGKSTK